MAKKKKDIIVIPDFSFEEAMRHLSNVRAEDVDEAMEADEYSEDAPIDEESCEPPEQCK